MPSDVMPRYQKVSVLVPSFNERPTLQTLLERLITVPWPIASEIVLVDDGSTDGSLDIARAFAVAHPILKVIAHETNQGKGAALCTALASATGDVVVIQDADLEYDPFDLISVVSPILSGAALVSYGSRVLNRGSRAGAGRWVLALGNRAMTALTNLLFDAALSDCATCYKAFDVTLLRSLPIRSRGFEFCTEVTARVRQKQVDIHEVAIRYTPRSAHEGKKLKYRHGLVMGLTLMRVKAGW